VDLTTTLLLAGAGLAAGAMNAVAGGGTFAAFPALLAAGLAPTVANATSIAALLPGAGASAWTYRRELRPVGAMGARSMIALTVVGGAGGAWLLHLTSEAAFRTLTPWLLLAASVALTCAGPIRRRLERTGWSLGWSGTALLQVLIGVYGGYFGGAVGLIMLACWVLASNLDAKALAPARTLCLAAANAAACLLFGALGLIAWAPAAWVALGAIAGGYLGARLGTRLPPAYVRGAVLAVSYVTTLAFFLRG
jgi:uncharacterized protein